MAIQLFNSHEISMNPEEDFDNDGSYCQEYEDYPDWDEPEYPEEQDVVEDYALEDRYPDY